MILSDIFDRAADVIEPDGAWIQGRAAAGADIETIEPRDPRACRWCVLGAILKVMGRKEAGFDAAVITMARHVRGKVHQWNDTEGRTQAEVVATLRALASAERVMEGGQ